MSGDETIWKEMMNECRKLELPVVPVFGGEPWFSITYICNSWLQIEKAADFVKKCKTAEVPMIRVNQKPCVRLSDVLAMYRSEGAES
jgi:hypothetical protein